MKHLNIFFSQCYRIYSGFHQIFRYKRTINQKFILIINFLRIEGKRLMAKFIQFHPVHEHFLNYHVSFPEYIAFGNMFIDIFVFEEYSFDGPDDALIIDCGSNIGMSVLYFKHAYPNSRIVAFEPDSNTYEYLAHNIETNRLQNVHLNKLAVFDKEGEITFYSAYEEDAASRLEMSVYQSSLGERQVKSQFVPCARLSSFIDQPVDLVKLDVQGSEVKVLEDLAENGKLTQINDFIIEYHYDPINNPLGRLISILEANKYYVSIHTIHETRLPPYDQYLGVPYTFVVFASKRQRS